jgi:lipopolysaccharide/colanic/teichoic acid biosynthesis glycosyltransferase
VATSERAFTTVGARAAVQERTAPAHSFAIRPIWQQMLLDFVTIVAALAFAAVAFGEQLVRSSAHGIPPLAMATMTITVFFFAGAYPRRLTPLDIGDMEGLLRGLGCATVLLTIGYIGTRSVPGMVAVVTVLAVVVLLIAQREFGHLVRRKQPWPTQQRFSSSSVTQILVMQPEGECEMYPEAAYVQSAAVHLLKRAVDVIGAAMLLAVALPLMTIVAVLIRLDSKGPVLIRQRRIGKHGAPFYIWKFRSMHNDVSRYARSPVCDNDPRLTRFGRALRRYSIDELPQLLNVFTGEMSLVGPRPEMPFIVRKYKAHQRLRLLATPGITGLWQISPARAMPIHENLRFDLFYIENQNIFLDFAILLRTASAVVRGIGAT